MADKSLDVAVLTIVITAVLMFVGLWLTISVAVARTRTVVVCIAISFGVIGLAAVVTIWRQVDQRNEPLPTVPTALPTQVAMPLNTPTPAPSLLGTPTAMPSAIVVIIQVATPLPDETHTPIPTPRPVPSILIEVRSNPTPTDARAHLVTPTPALSGTPSTNPTTTSTALPVPTARPPDAKPTPPPFLRTTATVVVNELDPCLRMRVSMLHVPPALLPHVEGSVLTVTVDTDAGGNIRWVETEPSDVHPEVLALAKQRIEEASPPPHVHCRIVFRW